MKQKTFFKILSVSICLVLILMGFNTYTYASITDTTNTGKITVSGIEAGVKVSAYQLTTVNYDYTADQPQATPYTWNSAVKTWVDANYSAYSDPEAFHNAVTDNSAEAKAFYSALSAAIKAGTVSISATKEATATGTASYPVTAEKLTGSVEFTGCEMGTYLILIENGYMVYTPSVVNLTPTFNTTSKEWELASEVAVTVKATNPQITKTVTNDTLTKDNYSTKDEITYTIIADVPKYEQGSLSKDYYIADELGGGLSMVVATDSIMVYGLKGSGDPVNLTNGVQYEVVAESLKKGKIEFNYDLISSYDSVKIVYRALLDQSTSTIIGSTGNVNTATLTYSNNPYVADSIQTQESTEVTVFTYGAEITKVDKSNNTVTLTGAEFTLASGADTLYFVKTADGVYYLANSTDTGATQTLAVDANGKLCLYGLDTGTYSLTETKAPEGYNKATTPATITITDADLDGLLDDGTTGIFTLNFPNGQGFQLPVTGGVGTVLFAAGGVVFVGLGITLLAVVIKKSHARK